MKKSFTKEEIIKKHETNVKSAFTTFGLVGILGLFYILRYLIKKEFDFHFSLSFTDMLLKLQNSGEITTAVCAAGVAVFLIIYIVSLVLTLKNQKFLTLAFAVYLFDFLTLLFCVFVLWEQPLNNEWIIDAVIHLFGIIFLVAGMVSNARLRSLNEQADS